MALFYFFSLSVTFCYKNVPNQFKMAPTIIISPKIGFGIDVFCLLKHICSCRHMLWFFCVPNLMPLNILQNSNFDIPITSGGIKVSQSVSQLLLLYPELDCGGSILSMDAQTHLTISTV